MRKEDVPTVGVDTMKAQSSTRSPTLKSESPPYTQSLVVNIDIHLILFIH